MNNSTIVDARKEAVLRETKRLFDEIGVPTKLLGRVFLQSAMILLFENQKLKLELQKYLYVGISQRHNANIFSVAKRIQFAIDATWLHGDKEALKKYFNYSEDAYCPTASEFIGKLRDIIMLRLLNYPEDFNDIIA